jgi:hypothetical protein
MEPVIKAGRHYIASEDWGTPNPRDRDAYPDTTSMVQWAWEFLRRRDDYRSAWEEHVQPFVDGDRFDLVAVRRNNLEAFNAWPGLQPESGVWDWTPPWERLRYFHIYGHPVSSTPHNRTLNPRSSMPPGFEGLGVTTVEMQSTRVRLQWVPHQNGSPQGVRPEPASTIVISYDLTMPIKPQLESAEVTVLLAANAYRERGDGGARDVTQSTARLQAGKFRRYLRLLDFDAASASDSEIGSYLFPDASGEQLRVLIRDTDKLARRWQDDYWRIALHSDAA